MYLHRLSLVLLFKSTKTIEIIMTYTEDQAKEAIRLYPHLTGDMKISGQAMDVYLYLRIRSDGLTASKVSQVWGVSLQHSNQILKSLVKKGYCERESKPQGSGGYEFSYKSI